MMIVHFPNYRKISYHIDIYALKISCDPIVYMGTSLLVAVNIAQGHFLSCKMQGKRISKDINHSFTKVFTAIAIQNEAGK